MRGTLDLLLVAGLVLAALDRTPAGVLLHAAGRALVGAEVGSVDPLALFVAPKLPSAWIDRLPDAPLPAVDGDVLRPEERLALSLVRSDAGNLDLPEEAALLDAVRLALVGPPAPEVQQQTALADDHLWSRLSSRWSGGTVLEARVPPSAGALDGAKADTAKVDGARVEASTGAPETGGAALTRTAPGRGNPLRTKTFANALTIVLLGEEITARAISRAEATGAADPEDPSTLRAYVPAHARQVLDRVVIPASGLATALALQDPIDGNPRISSRFGMRVHPVFQRELLHAGVDYAVPVGTPVRAAQRGTVAKVGEDARSGRFVVLDHGAGVRTTYCHLSEIDVQRGETVDLGVEFARSGNTGRSTGPHLHYGLRVAGEPVDPLRLKPKSEPTS